MGLLSINVYPTESYSVMMLVVMVVWWWWWW
jgi:hypothetical protein